MVPEIEFPSTIQLLFNCKDHIYYFNRINYPILL